jgi:S1-C subfamily serine protease
MKRRALAFLLLLSGAVCHADLSAKEQQAVVPINANGRWNGSGFFVGDHLYTAYHVVCSGHITLVDYYGRLYDVDVVSYDVAADWAKCYVSGYKPLHKLRWETGMANGEQVAAYGWQDSGLNTTTGEVRYAFYNERAALTTAKVRGGYSGGPVIDRTSNRVLGIVTQCTGWSNRFYGNSIITRLDVIR